MSVTPLLQITQVSSSQNNKEVTINDGFLAIERSLNDQLSLDFTAGDVTLNLSDFARYFVLITTPVPAPANLIIPQSKRVFGIKNDGAATITVKTGAVGGTSSPVEAGTRAVLFCDGTNVHYFASGAQPGTSLFYDLGFQYIGVPGNSEKQEFLAVRAFTLPSGGGASKAKAGVAATGSTVLSIQKNGAQIGTITFAASGTVGTFAVAADTAFAIGDMLTVVTPLAPDATLADIAITLACTR